MKDHDKIVEKISNLLSLANNNPNENEAIAAALKAQELMAKYDIEIVEIEGKAKEEEEIIKNIISFEKNTGYCIKWRFSLARVIADNFRVKFYSIGRDDVCFYGYKSDAKIAGQVFNYIFSTGNKLSCKYYYKCKNAGKNTKGVMNAYLTGFIKGLKDVLEKQSHELMIVTPQEVSDKYEEMIKGKGFRSFNTSISSAYDPDAYETGRQEGRDTANARSIESSSKVAAC